MNLGRKFRLVTAPHVIVDALQWSGYNFAELEVFTERRCFIHATHRRKLWIKEPHGWNLLEVGGWVLKSPCSSSVDYHGFILRGLPSDSFTAVYEPILPGGRPPTRWARLRAWITCTVNRR